MMLSRILFIEIWKLLKRGRSYIGILAIIIILVLIEAGLYFDGQSLLDTFVNPLRGNFYLQGNLLNGYLVTFFALNTLWIHIPILIVIVTGDFNSTPSDDPYKIITDVNNPDRLTDSKAVCVTPHYGPTGTFNDFKSKETSNEPIDYIFVKGKVRVLKHATLSQSWQGHFSSDHFPVFARLSFKRLSV